jgi:hypothetical protein
MTLIPEDPLAPVNLVAYAMRTLRVEFDSGLGAVGAIDWLQLRGQLPGEARVAGRPVALFARRHDPGTDGERALAAD